ncbi:MAG: LacI family DNA-binding transcriptional regulator [Actinomycetaceae bacterium]|nr:LacI family DNA-binding transcriptional regulator [Actinomycetaceae bacterium]MDU0970978.1 LacI family DNA-binding transcriptional regulator [Actinomycetaceae bacterium]
MATIKDVAKAAGVSIATVSRALNGSGPLADETRERVFAAADQLGYRRDARAAGMRTGRTDTVGLILGDITNPYFSRLAAYIEEAVERWGKTLQIANAHDNPYLQARAIKTFVAQRVDGLLVVPPTQPFPEAVVPMHTFWPTVLLDREVPGQDAPTVTIDTSAALEQLADHLFDVGYRRPALLVGPTTTSTGLQRRQSAHDALKRHGYLDLQISETDYSKGHARQVAGQLLVEYCPDVVICTSNQLTEGLLGAAKALGLRIGRDLGVATVDDLGWYRVVTPSLTAIEQPLRDLAFTAVDTLKDAIETSQAQVPGPHGRIVAAEGRLIIRESTPGPANIY